MTNLMPRAALAMLLSLLATPVVAVVRSVPSQYPTIQAGIDAASNGDVVEIAPGTYTGIGNRNIDLRGKTIRVEGVGGRDVTIIDCEGSAATPRGGILFSGGETMETVVSGLTIMNAYSTGSGELDAIEGFGSTIEGVVEHCRITNCISETGNVIRTSSVEIRDTIIENCTAVSTVVDFRSSTLRRVEIRDNNSSAIRVSGANVKIDSCLVMGNQGNGIALFFTENCLIEDTVISGNKTQALSVEEGINTIIRRCTIVGTSLHGMMGTESTVQMESTVIWGNRHFGNIWSGSWTLECCVFPEGAADGQGFTLIGNQIHEDPFFCDSRDWTEAPTSEGDYSVAAVSSCLPENNFCGIQIGALGFGDCVPASAPDADLANLEQPGLESTSALPARGEIRFRTELGAGAVAVAQVIDLTGRIVASKTLTAAAGEEIVWRLDGSTIRSGVYFLRVHSAGGTEGRTPAEIRGANSRGTQGGIREASRKFVWLGR